MLIHRIFKCCANLSHLFIFRINSTQVYNNCTLSRQAKSFCYYILRAIKADHIFLDFKTGVRLGGFHHTLCITECDRWIGTNHQIQHFDDTLSDVFLWLAPEVLKQDLNGYGTKSDIYSVGICICEMGNGFAPFQEMEPLQILYEKLRGSTPFLLDAKTNGGRAQAPERTTQFSDALHQIVSDCLCYEPRSRPNARKLLEDNRQRFEDGSKDLFKEIILKEVTPSSEQ